MPIVEKNNQIIIKIYIILEIYKIYIR